MQNDEGLPKRLLTSGRHIQDAISLVDSHPLQDVTTSTVILGIIHQQHAHHPLSHHFVFTGLSGHPFLLSVISTDDCATLHYHIISLFFI